MVFYLLDANDSLFFLMQLKKLVEKPAEPVPNGIENGDGADDEGNEWQVRIN